MNAVEQDEARVQVEQGQRAELVCLIRWADSCPNGDAFLRVLSISTLPRIETAEAFDRARAYFRDGRHGLAHHEIGVILGTVRFTPGQQVRMESRGACPSCGGRDLVFAYPDPDRPDEAAFFRCEQADEHVSGVITFARDWSAVAG